MSGCVTLLISGEMGIYSVLFQDENNGSLGDFVLEWNSSRSQDVVLRRKSESGEEVAVSALLSQKTYDTEGIFPRKLLMKVCVKRPGLSSILQFDCGVSEKGVRRSDFKICSAYFLQSTTVPGSSIYRGPLFRWNFALRFPLFKEYMQ